MVGELTWSRRLVGLWLPLALLFLLAFLGYPFCYGVYLSFVKRPVAQPATFVGLGNFVNLWNDAIFWQAVWNTFRFTAAATVLKLVGGLGMALDTAMSNLYWDQAGLVLFVIFAIVIAVEIVTAWIRARII